MIKLKISFRFIVTIASIIVAILLGLTRISDPEFVQVLRLKYFDQLQIKYPRVTEGQTYSVIVDIDEKSLREIGQWPWPRTVLADLFNKSREAGMLVLGLDVLFAEKDRTSPELIAEDVKERSPEIANLLKTLPSNESLAMEAMKAFPTVIGHSGLDVQGDANRNDIKDTSVKVFLGKNKKPKDWLIKYPGLLANVTEFEKAASGAGTVSVAEEPDGIIRRVPLISNVAGVVRPTLGLDMIRVAFKGNSIATRTGLNGVEEIIIQTKAIGNASIPTDENGRVWIYYGESDSIKKENSRRYYVSAVDIINGKVGKDRLSGKLGILGTSATGLKDIRPTPVEDRMPGVEIHANLIDTVISAILYYTSNKNANAVYNQSIKKGMSESEALAEKMHEAVRKNIWGYSSEESFNNSDLIKEKYIGIRPAPGYPACPDHSEKEKIWKLLDIENNSKMKLTESYAVSPASSVTGWYFSHPESKYFSISQISNDQLKNYAKRKGDNEEIFKKIFPHILEL